MRSFSPARLPAPPVGGSRRRAATRLLPSLLRCAGSSLLAVAFELGLLILLVQVFHTYYLLAAVAAGALYAVLNFLVNRRWAFRSRHAAPWPQFARHLAVVGGGMALGTALLWLLVGRVGLPYPVGWGIGGSLCFLGWTFPMQRFFAYAPAT
jgi:putative flippase GtrA